MRKHADALKSYVDLLESLLEKCRLEHGGPSDAQSSYLQFRPPDQASLPDCDILPEPVVDPIPAEDDIVQELCVPARNLKVHVILRAPRKRVFSFFPKLEDSDLFFYGIAAPFRFEEAPISPKNKTSRLPSTMRSYVLQLTATDGNNYNPHFDWSRHLPGIVPLDRSEHDRFVNHLLQ